SRSRCRARRARSRRRRPALASTPTWSSRNSDSAPRISRRCARPTRSDAPRKARQAMNDMSSTDKMLSRKEGGVGYGIFNNPERQNAVSLDMWEAASRMLDDFAKDPEVRVLVVTGAGGKAFISGADISKFEKERSSEEAVARYNVIVDKANSAFYDFP